MASAEAPKGDAAPEGAESETSQAEAPDARAALARLGEEVVALRGLFESRLANDTVKAEAFERLYRQLDETRREREVGRQRALLWELLQLRDRLDQLEATRERQEGAAVVRSIADELDEILIRRMVTRIVPTDDRFDPATQEAVARNGEGGPMDTLRVTEVVRPGYRCGELILRPAQVVVEAEALQESAAEEAAT
jgi:molecular chaperone GrpE